MEQMLWALHRPTGEPNRFEALSCRGAQEARAFHRSFPQYAPTPLVDLPAMAAHLGLARLSVKDESRRFGLNAFKVLGGSYAIMRAVAQKAGRDPREMTHAILTSEAFLRDVDETVFFTATDGNHGRGVAWAARELGRRAVVRMPRGTARSRLENISSLGAEVTVEDMNYDDCVRLAAAQAAATPGGIVVQDTAWDGYEQIPLWIMQGYGTMAAEADEQLGDVPTHVFLQAGVGSMAASVAAYFRDRYREKAPTVAVLEAAGADCFYRSALAGDMRNVGGDLRTMMAGLACGEPSPQAWEVLRATAAAFVSCPDDLAASGMRMLAAPLPGDKRVVSGESGAIGIGALWAIMAREACAPLRAALKLGGDARVLLLSTEGDTDPENYKAVLRGDKYPDA